MGDPNRVRNEKAMEGNGVNQAGEIQARSWPFMLVCGAGQSQEIIAKRQRELLCRVEGKALAVFQMWQEVSSCTFSLLCLITSLIRSKLTLECLNPEICFQPVRKQA